ncbi:uncharacterized protein LOC117789432 [Drosophila innubila]|uniref:uncharacterized protein LOC117789432 n=1 Tax=Drosophila innubila TaxID=198719 RepID=UPI00148E2948|nr:uncharacterized protein LOC117789432 [Drosophila innubila]
MNEGKMKLIYEEPEESDLVAETESEEHMESQNTIPLPKHNRRSYVWRYFTPVPDHSEVYRCKICSETFGNKTANLGRHLQTVHSVSDIHLEDSVKKGRPNRSIVWNFCTKLDHKRALCHLCKKVLYFGGGNTSNITKHLKRMHAEKIDEMANRMPRNVRWGTETKSCTKERRGSSYVWNYCEKLTKNTVLCKLCNRKMRFHGTANVITHLQRRHDIMDETSCVKIESPGNIQEAAMSSTNENATSRRSSVSGSVVWKYITRLSEDTVRCRVCLKNLSYQGTSNLQRHLHRMHNIIWNLQDTSLPVKTETDPSSEDSFFDFCESTSDPSVWKCQMCEEHFEDSEHMQENISTHMIKVHGAAMRRDYGDESPATEGEEQQFVTLYSPIAGDDAERAADQVDIAVPDTDTDEALYNEIIEVEEDDLNDLDDVGEQLIESENCENSLSAQSGENVYSDFSNDSNDAQLVTTTIQADDTPLMRELKEDLLRQQAIYFSEKAGFYRMQKFLVAQQVRKERLEFERLNAMGKSEESVNNLTSS